MNSFRCCLALLCCWACSDAPTPSGDSPGAAGETGTPDLREPCADCAAPTLDVSEPLGTQTGGEGEQMYCGEERPRWELIDEPVALEGTYAGLVRLASGASSPARLTLSDHGPVSAAVYAADAPNVAECGRVRRAELTWTLSVEGALEIAARMRLDYSTRGTGELGDVFDLAALQLFVPAPTPQDFRNAGGAPPPSNFAGDAGDGGIEPVAESTEGPVQVSLYGGMAGDTVQLQAMWFCSNCGTNRVGLPLADGKLERVE
jgi:hypothetical protein